VNQYTVHLYSTTQLYGQLIYGMYSVSCLLADSSSADTLLLLLKKIAVFRLDWSHLKYLATVVEISKLWVADRLELCLLHA
jgi:hypothetical protein